MGWLLVGLFMARRAARLAARNAARAVYFELEANRTSVSLARDYGSFPPLARSTYERLLPELAILLGVPDLSVLAAAYLAHSGYEQLRQSQDHPLDARHMALTGILGAQDAGLGRLRGIAFTPIERSQLAAAANPGGAQHG